MSIAVASSYSSIAQGMIIPFIGSGGTAPYTYSVDGGGAGGVIDSATGFYTAPSVTGTDTIRVTDSVSATATTSIAVLSALELVCDIIQNQMGLANGRVYLWDQMITQPKDNALYIAVGVLSCKPFANTSDMDGSGSGMNVIQSTNFQATVSIDILSRGPDARDRKEEVIMALGSPYAKQQMEANSFYIAPLTTAFTNLSVQDGAAIMYRFNLSVAIQYMVKKTVAVPYYGTFTKSVSTNK